MENETFSDQAEDGTVKSADELPLVDIMEIDVIPQAEMGSEKNIVSQGVLSEKPKPHVVGGRRNSTGNREGRPLPIYLRASTSSCHDFCKYGREHSFPNREPRRPIRALIQENKESRVHVETEFKRPTISGQKKKQATKAEASSSPKLTPQLPSSSKVIKQKAITPAKKIEITIKPTISSKSKLKPPVSKTSPSPSSQSGGLAKRNGPSSISLNRLRRLGSLRKNRINLVRPSNSLGDLRGEKSGRAASNHSENSNGQRRSDGMLTKSRGLFNPVERKTPRSSLSTPTPKPSNGAAHLNLLKYQKTKKPSLEDIQTKVRISRVKEDKVSKKTLYMIEPKAKRNTSMSSRHSGSSTLYMIEPKAKRNPSLSSRHSGSSTLYTIEPTAKRNSSMSSRHSGSSSPSSPSTLSRDNEDTLGSESTISEAEGLVSDQEDTETSVSGEVSKDGAKRTGRQRKVVHPEDKDEVAQKVSFRRGRVVTLQTENNVPRRLRFRQGRVSGESQNGKSDPGRRSFRKKKELGAPILDKPDAGAESVVLRHQDVQGKKEELGLFNEVIEETASKLVETRKSKVKALVGAFETVISLQESKPATSA